MADDMPRRPGPPDEVVQEYLEARNQEVLDMHRKWAEDNGVPLEAGWEAKALAEFDLCMKEVEGAGANRRR